jgi:hypothetical protein
MNRADRAFFAHVCKLTCFGGSEKGTCDCRGPLECKARDHPGFEQAHREAVQRMSRLLQSELTKSNRPE